MRLIASLAWRDLRASGRYLWVFWACLMLGVTLIAASGGLHAQVSASLLADTRTLFGGDLEVRQREPLRPAELDWLRAHGDVSLLVELRTMLMTADGRTQIVELQVLDDVYPLYGVVELTPAQPVASAVARRDGRWGGAFDPLLTERLGLAAGDRVEIGAVEVELTARIERQPDRSLRADWRGPPLMLAAGALAESALVQPGSRLSYRYRVRTGRDVDDWRAALTAAFPDTDFEVRTFAERSRRLAEVLGQLGAGLLLIGFSALFIGGIGVFNSVQAYLQAKLATIATLRALGLRERRLAAVYLCQVLLLAASASVAGALAGGVLALAGAEIAAARLPLAPALADLAVPLAVAGLFGVLTALTFALPALGRALSVSPAALFRGVDAAATATPARYWRATALGGAGIVALVLAALPEPLFGLGFVLVTLLLLALLEGLVRALRALALRLSTRPLLAGRIALALALASLHRPGSPLRPTLISLGSALTVLVSSTLVVAALLETLNETVPERAPALVFHDVSSYQLEQLRTLVEGAASLERLDLAPLVLGRLARVNGESLRASARAERALEARDEHKMSHRQNNFDHVVIDRGAWWPRDYVGPPLVAMEDREADQIGLAVGDRLQFEIMGRTVEARLAAIYSQRRLEARFWLEAIFTDGTLDPFITRHVGTAYLDGEEARGLRARIAAAMPNVITVRTDGILAEARAMLARASAGLAVVAGVSLAASLLVLVSVVATCRARQVYDATVLHTLGARIAVIRRSLQLEYALIALLTTAFAVLAGSALASALLEHRLELDADGVWWLGPVTAIAVSGASLGLGARYLLARLRLTPAVLLRASG